MGDNQRRGPWSRIEKEYIRANYKTQSAQELAKHLRRNVDAVRKYVEQMVQSPNVEHTKAANDSIKNSPVWKDLKKQFTPEELDMFLFHWGRIIAQFAEDVLPTEELQIIDAIKIEIMMNRMLNQQQAIIKDISSLETEINVLIDTEPDERKIGRARSKLAEMRQGMESMRRSYRELLERKNGILRDMKSTRDQRLKLVENSKKDFGAWMKRIIEDKGLRKRLGLDMEKMRIAMEAEYKRLTEYHTYADGEVDVPLLTPESIPEDY